MIIGVAVKFGDSIEIRLPRPNRHCDCFALFQKIAKDTPSNLGLNTNGKYQGFYTHTGRYLTREQAGKYARRVKQRTDYDGGVPYYGPLCSEDLWPKTEDK
jgi:hypothetical protein